MKKLKKNLSKSANFARGALFGLRTSLQIQTKSQDATIINALKKIKSERQANAVLRYVMNDRSNSDSDSDNDLIEDYFDNRCVHPERATASSRYLFRPKKYLKRKFF